MFHAREKNRFFGISFFSEERRFYAGIRDFLSEDERGIIYGFFLERVQKQLVETKLSFFWGHEQVTR